MRNGLYLAVYSQRCSVFACPRVRVLSVDDSSSSDQRIARLKKKKNWRKTTSLGEEVERITYLNPKDFDRWLVPVDDDTRSTFIHLAGGRYS